MNQEPSEPHHIVLYHLKPRNQIIIGCFGLDWESEQVCNSLGGVLVAEIQFDVTKWKLSKGLVAYSFSSSPSL
jgi:hypothetical protein